jgi:hypothetical protein
MVIITQYHPPPWVYLENGFFAVMGTVHLSMVGSFESSRSDFFRHGFRTFCCCCKCIRKYPIRNISGVVTFSSWRSGLHTHFIKAQKLGQCGVGMPVECSSLKDSRPNQRRCYLYEKKLQGAISLPELSIDHELYVKIISGNLLLTCNGSSLYVCSV